MNNIENEKTAVAENSKSMKDDDLFLINSYARLHEDLIVETEGNCVGLSHKKYSEIEKEPEAKISFIYNCSLNTVICLKYNKKDGTNYKSDVYKFEGIEDLKTFLDWFGEVNEYCEENNVCYDTISENLNKSGIVDKFINPKNPNLKLVRSKNNTINFVKDGITIEQFICNDIDNSTKFTDFAKNTFQFCEENNFPFERYPSEISTNMLKLQFGIYNILNEKCKEDNDIKILSKSFDKNGSSVFIYLSNGTVKSCTYDDAGICISTVVKPFTKINNVEDFSNWIENDVKIFCNWSGFSYADYSTIIQNRPDILYGILQKITNKKTLKNITNAVGEVEKLNSNSKELNQ